MSQFKGRRGDLKWGKYKYPVTRTQKETLDGLRYMMRGLPRAPVTNDDITHPSSDDIPVGYFCSQRANNGDVVIGLNNHSVSVHRSGRITSNA